MNLASPWERKKIKEKNICHCLFSWTMVIAYHCANLDFQRIRTYRANPFIKPETLL